MIEVQQKDNDVEKRVHSALTFNYLFMKIDPHMYILIYAVYMRRNKNNREIKTNRPTHSSIVDTRACHMLSSIPTGHLFS